ncbi:unnamed protein product [Brassica rapa]|uniref:Uncharacterized protein n=2 Tax=Brassica TaxID=3705 RepID=A0A8D9HWE9_BRACM|nr:unnamed protein product [Brassica napus]CAG7904819.1 unnamed protein product [Brassica rapa]
MEYVDTRCRACVENIPIKASDGRRSLNLIKRKEERERERLGREKRQISLCLSSLADSTKLELSSHTKVNYS